MNLLLDTHTVIWFITNDKSLSDSAKKSIEDMSNTCFVSIASLWEMSIKYRLGKLELNMTIEVIFDLIEQTGFEILPIFPEHLLVNSQLELHHRDPFDRLIISQAIFENYTTITKDPLFTLYDVDLLW
jgi:PIN domain nuclease of toxin-antitoxin system